MLASFALALSFLTILRIPGWSFRTAGPSELAAGFVFFPAVGALLGTIWAVLAVALRGLLPPAVAAVLLVLVMALLTRGLHLDGLADLADGLGGGFTPARRLEIMKDSRIGTFGATVLILILALKIVSLQALLQMHQWEALLLAPMLSRLGVVLTAFGSPYPRPEGGLGKSFCEQLNLGQLLLATVLPAVGVVVLSPRIGGLMTLGLLVCVGTLRLGAKRWLGGVTGDVLGALNEIAEALLLCLASAVAWNP